VRHPVTQVFEGESPEKTLAQIRIHITTEKNRQDLT
jgi:hypothetical protein